MESEPTINIDEFVKNLSSSVESLPTKDLELCDLANEIGIALARLAGAEKFNEREVLAGIDHGFDLVRKKMNTANSNDELEFKEWIDTHLTGKEII